MLTADRLIPSAFSTFLHTPQKLTHRIVRFAAACSDGPSRDDRLRAARRGRRPARASRHYKPNVRQAGPPRLRPLPPRLRRNGDIGWRHKISARYSNLQPAPPSPGTKCGNPAPVISPLFTPAAIGWPGYRRKLRNPCPRPFATSEVEGLVRAKSRTASADRLGFARRMSRLRSTRTDVG